MFRDKRNMKRFHLGIKEWQCSICHHELSSNQRLKSHERDVHGIRSRERRERGRRGRRGRGGRRRR